MTTITAQTRRSPLSAESMLWMLSTATVVVLFSGFAYSHVSHWLTTGRPTGLVFAVQEAVAVVLFLLRRRPKETTRSPFYWIVGLVGTFTMLLFRPIGHSVLGLDGLYLGLQVVGAVLAVYGTLHLGRSIGIVAANRGVKDSGPYRVVRHPLYAAYLVSHVGYILSALSWFNVLVLAITWLAMSQRIGAEEKVLSRDVDYQQYMSRVPYRLIPRLF